MNHPTDRYESKTPPKPHPVEDWKEIDWKKVEVNVFKLQKRIYRASRSGDISKVHKLHPPLSPHEMGGKRGVVCQGLSCQKGYSR